MNKASAKPNDPARMLPIPEENREDMHPAPKGPCAVGPEDVFLELNSNQFGVIEIHRCSHCKQKAFCWSRTFEQWVTIPATSPDLMAKLMALVQKAVADKAPGWWP